jgi:hypothetical protein
MNLADLNDKSRNVSLELVAKLLHTAVVPALNLCLQPTIVTEGFNCWRRKAVLEQPALNFARAAVSLSLSLSHPF